MTNSPFRARATAISGVLTALFLGGCFQHYDATERPQASVKDTVRAAPAVGGWSHGAAPQRPAVRKVAMRSSDPAPVARKATAVKAEADPIAPKEIAPQKAEAPVERNRQAIIVAPPEKPQGEAVARMPDAAVPMPAAPVAIAAPKQPVTERAIAERATIEPRRAPAAGPQVAANIPQAPVTLPQVAPKMPAPAEPKVEAPAAAVVAPQPKAPVAVNIQPKPAAPAGGELAVQPKVAAISEDQRVRDTITKAGEYLTKGSFINARALLQDVGRGENGELLVALAETYDPLVLAKKYPRYARAGDTTRALELYQRAASKGASTASQRIDALKAHVANPNR